MATKTASLYLRPIEVKQLAQLAHESGDVASASDFRTWAQTRVRKLFPHEALIAGLARRSGAAVSVEALVSAGFPMGFIESVTRRRGHFVCPTLDAWFQQQRPQLFDPAHARAGALPATEEFEAFDLKNVAAHGVLRANSASATYFSFSQLPAPLTERHAFMLELLAPHLHRAYLNSRVDAGLPPATGAQPRLTACERLVLQQLNQDSSTKAVALALGRSDNTVKHQIQSVLRKLGASDRAEAVTTAIRLKLLPDRRDPTTPAI